MTIEISLAIIALCYVVGAYNNIRNIILQNRAIRAQMEVMRSKEAEREAREKVAEEMLKKSEKK